MEQFQEKWHTLIDNQLNRDISVIANDQKFTDMLTYAVLNGGKRLRPILTLAVLDSFGVHISPQLLKLTTAVEWIHSYSLVHDDLPAMDNDLLRRGKPSLHAKFGEDMAILAGDALLTGAFQIIAESNDIGQKDLNISDQLLITVTQQLSLFSGGKGMVIGQVHDMQNHGQRDKILKNWLLDEVYVPKTAALLSFSAGIGGLLLKQFVENLTSYANTSHDLFEFGKNFGLAFQIQDDLDDYEQDNQEDVASLPHIIGLDAARDLRNQFISQAKQCLDLIAKRETCFNRDLLDSFLNIIGD